MKKILFAAIGAVLSVNANSQDLTLHGAVQFPDEHVLWGDDSAPVERRFARANAWKTLAGRIVMRGGLDMTSLAVADIRTLLWACLVAVITQYFLNLEIMRWTLATGESTSGTTTSSSTWKAWSRVCSRERAWR